MTLKLEKYLCGFTALLRMASSRIGRISEYLSSSVPFPEIAGIGRRQAANHIIADADGYHVQDAFDCFHFGRLLGGLVGLVGLTFGDGFGKHAVEQQRDGSYLMMDPVESAALLLD